jgi:hypothetical protein
MQAGEGELHLGLDAGRSRDAAPQCAYCQMVQQRGLPDSRVTSQDQDPTVPASHILQQSIKRFALAMPTAQFLPTMKLGHTRSLCAMRLAAVPAQTAAFSEIATQALRVGLRVRQGDVAVRPDEIERRALETGSPHPRLPG